MIPGRNIKVEAIGKLVLLDYDEIFVNQYGASDFIAITKKFEYVFVKNWKVTHLTEKNKMRKWVR